MIGPLAVSSVTATVPDPAGAMASTSVSDTTVKLCAGVVPNSTPVVADRPEPLTWTRLPPLAGPSAGRSALAVGQLTTGMMVAPP